MSRPHLIGLSHLFGESQNLDLTTKFWKQQGLSFQEFELPVTEEKSELFLTSPAKETTLRYFKSEGPGFEFLEHRPHRQPAISSPRISVFFSGLTPQILEDPDRNQIITDPSLKFSTTLKIRTHALALSKIFFDKMGFEPSRLNADEAVLLEVPETTIVYKLQAKLFPQMSCRILPIEDSTLTASPKIDGFGLNGLSFIVPSLKEAESILSLKAHQDFEDPLSHKRVAFTNEFGMMIELLEIVKRKSK